MAPDVLQICLLLSCYHCTRTSSSDVLTTLSRSSEGSLIAAVPEQSCLFCPVVSAQRADIWHAGEQGNVDKAYFRELEALYLLRLLQLSCLSNLESCAFDLQDATAVLTAPLQRELPRSSHESPHVPYSQFNRMPAVTLYGHMTL